MGKFLELITKEYMEGVSEPWCNNKGIAVLPFVYRQPGYWFLLIDEKNPLFNDTNNENIKLSTLTGGCENNNPDENVKKEILEETGIDISSNKSVTIYKLGKYYANKSSIKVWYLYAVNLTALKLNLVVDYDGEGDKTVGEKIVKGKFVHETNLGQDLNDSLALAIYAKLILHKIITFSQHTPL